MTVQLPAVFQKWSPLSRDCGMGAIFILAIAARIGFLVYNLEFVNLPPTWGVMARVGLDFAHGLSTPMFGAEDRGILILYWLVERIFPAVTHTKIQILQALCDSLMVFAAAAIGRCVGGERAGLAAGMSYALFPPQLFLASFPGYESWFAMTMLLMTLSFLRLNEAPSKRLWKDAAIFIILLLLAAQFRSITVLFGIAAGFWSFLVAVMTESRPLPRRIWVRAGICLLSGGIAIASNVLINQAIRGEASPIRGGYGHTFWAGIGQYANPYGVQNDDASVGAFYTRETGLNAPNAQRDSLWEYNAWLTQRGIRFVQEQPGLYASMVMRRALSILMPNMPVTMVADNPAFIKSADEADRIKARKAALADLGYASLRFWMQTAANDPGYLFGLAIRITLLLVLPTGYLAALILAKRRVAALALLPLAYIVVVLSPFYVTPVVVAATHAATLPVAAAGLVLLASHRRRSP